MPGNREKEFLKKYINFTLFTPKSPPLGMGGCHEMYSMSEANKKGEGA